MINSQYYAFVKSHNLINRIYDMLLFFHALKREDIEDEIKSTIKNRLEDVVYVEDLTVFFERKMNKNKKNIDLRYNLRDLIYDLEYLKQYLI